MDTLRIIQQEGYRRQDLNEENQKIMNWLDHLIEQLDNLKNNVEFIDEEIENPEFVAKEDRTILGTMKYEMACKVIDKAVEWLQIEAADVQIALAENEPDEEEQDKKGE